MPLSPDAERRLNELKLANPDCHEPRLSPEAGRRLNELLLSSPDRLPEKLLSIYPHIADDPDPIRELKNRSRRLASTIQTTLSESAQINVGSLSREESKPTSRKHLGRFFLLSLAVTGALFAASLSFFEIGFRGDYEQGKLAIHQLEALNLEADNKTQSFWTFDDLREIRSLRSSRAKMLEIANRIEYWIDHDAAERRTVTRRDVLESECRKLCSSASDLGFDPENELWMRETCTAWLARIREFPRQELNDDEVELMRLAESMAREFASRASQI